MATYPAESFYRGTIRQSIANNTSVPFTLKVSKIPTLTSWLLTVSPNTANEELIEYSGVDGTALTITVIKRWISPSAQALTVNGTDYNNVTYQKSHSQNDTIRGDVNHLHIIQTYGDLQAQIDTKLAIAWWLRTWMGALRQTVEIDATGAEVKKSIIDGTTISGTETLRKRKVDGTYEEIPFSVFGAALSPSAVVDKQYYAWESLALWDSVFAEGYSTFASATTVLNVSDVTANTRIFFPIFGSGIAMTTFKLAIRKAGTPTQNLNFRIETDDGTWKPSWTLFNANGTATIAQWSLTTSFADTTLTLAWSITIPAGQLCHIVMFQGTYWTETINNTNYYQVWVSSNHSNSRYAGWHNGTSYSRKWANSTGTLTGDAFNQTASSVTTTFTALKPFYLTQVNVSSAGTAIQPTVTVAQSTRGSMAVLASSYIASFSTPFLIYPWTFTINLNYGSAVNIRNPSAYSPSSPLFTSTPSLTYSIVWVVWQEEMTIPYVSSSGILSTVISKTSAFLSYKLWSYPSFATQIITKWSVWVRAILWEISVAGVLDNTLYYISDIDGWVSTSAWTNSSKAWKWFWTWTLFIDKYAT